MEFDNSKKGKAMIHEQISQIFGATRPEFLKMAGKWLNQGRAFRTKEPERQANAVRRAELEKSEAEQRALVRSLR